VGTYAHTLKPLRRGALPRRYIIIACAPVVTREGPGTPLFVHRLRVGALTYLHRDGSNSWTCKDHVFDSGARLLSLLDRYTSRREVTWLIAHNVAYHLTVGELWVHALSGEPLVEGYHFEGRTMSARLRIKGKLLHCVDAANYLDRPWEWVCSALRMPAPQEYGSDDTDSLALDKARLQVATVTELTMRLVQMMGADAGGAWGWSLGSLAWHSWRRGLMGDRVRVPADPEAHQLEREAYIGARTECRYLGEVHGTVNAVDYNSLYAHVMTGPCPVRLLGQSVGGSPARLHEGLIGGELAIARVTVDARNYDYPYRLWPGQSAPPAGGSTLPPYMARTTQWRRVWGRGKFTCVLATPELQRALEAGEVLDVARVSWYEPGMPFGPYTNHWYRRRLMYRKAGRPAEEAICKRLLTVLPGKFGQHARDWTDVPGKSAQLPFGHWWEWAPDHSEWKIFRSLAGCAQVYGSPGEWQHSCPGLSAHVTSGARVLTDAAVDIAGPLDCYYYDCDSLHVSPLGLERLADAGLVSETELGRLKVKENAHDAAYRNIRDYRLGRPTGDGAPKEARGACPSVARASRRVAPAAHATDHGHADADQLSAVSCGCPVYQLLRAGPECWRSIVSVRALARHRYVGRVRADGWVRPLWIPSDLPGRAKGELPYEVRSEQK